MARLAKSDVHAALRRAADHLIAAGGDDHRISRADVDARLATLRGIERTLVDLFYRFIDYRDYRAGAVVTVADVEEAFEYAREKLIDAYDTNNNGLSEAEIARMSTIGKLAVALAAELTEQPAVDLATFDADFIAAELRALVRDLTFISEANARFEPIVVPLAPTANLDLDTVRLLFGDVHDELARDALGFERQHIFDLDDARGEEREFGAWFAERRMPDDLLDPLEVERAVRTGELVDYLAAHVSEPRVFAYADPTEPLDPADRGALVGTVSVFVVGRNPEGWVVGVYTTSVES